MKDVPFQLWELTVYKDQSAVVTMKKDSDVPVIVKQKLHYTDFPLTHTKLYLTDGVIKIMKSPQSKCQPLLSTSSTLPISTKLSNSERNISILVTPYFYHKPHPDP